MKNKAIALIIGIFLSSYGHSQTIELPLLYAIKSDFLHQAAINQDTIHMSYAPLYSDKLSSIDNFPFLQIDTLQERSWGHRKLFNENFLILNKKNIYLTVDPIFNFSVGADLSNKDAGTLYTNTRGIQIEGVLAKNIIFSTSFLENQATFVSDVNTFIENNGVVPEMGRVKSFKNNGYDYAIASASVTWIATPFFRIQLGANKDFLGFAYRSVLLSDNAFNYPHLKMDFYFANRKLKYTLNYALLQDLVRMPDGETPESLFERKMGAFHYLSYMPHRSVSIGLFSGTILPQNNQDSVKNFYLDAFNPIFMINPIINNPNYINKIGINISWEAWKNGRIYLEFAENPADWNQYSYLVGFKTWDLLVQNLSFMLTFSSIQKSNQNPGQDLSNYFSHYSQALDHTLGSGFGELYTRLSYQYERIQFLLSFNYAERNLKEAQIWGFIDSDTVLPANGPEKTYSTILNSEISYLFNPKTAMNVALGYRLKRSGEEAIFGKSDYLYIAFRTTLFNQYLDF